MRISNSSNDRRWQTIAGILFFLILCTGCRHEGIIVQTDSAFVEMTEAEASAAADERIMVHVCGAVKTPGVYELSVGARVYEAVEAAGGFLPDADTQWCNQAQCVYDGEKLRIYTLDETAEMETAKPGSHDGLPEGKNGSAGLVNINTAGEQELMTLPGIGQSKARAILDYRAANGSFMTVDELTDVKGIGPSVLEKLRAYVTVQ